MGRFMLRDANPNKHGIDAICNNASEPGGDHQQALHDLVVAQGRAVAGTGATTSRAAVREDEHTALLQASVV